MHSFTQRGQWEIRVDYQKNDKTWSYLHYNQFSVGSTCEEYPLTVGGFTGVGSDKLSWHNGMKFTTSDNDNDKHGGNCAVKYKDGWWFNTCDTFDINRKIPNKYYKTIFFTEMKIRPKDCITQ